MARRKQTRKKVREESKYDSEEYRQIVAKRASVPSAPRRKRGRPKPTQVSVTADGCTDAKPKRVSYCRKATNTRKPR